MTWSTSDVSALGASDGDVSSAFDDFGNLFLVQFSSASALEVVVGLSTNGGASFDLLYETATRKNDQATIVTGPSLSSPDRSEEHTSEIQSRVGISYARFSLQKQQN